MRAPGRFLPRTPTALRAPTALHIACVAVFLASCTTPGNDGDTTPDPASPIAPTGDSSAPPVGMSTDVELPFRVVIGEQTVTGRLFDNATARDFASRLPITLTFADLHGVEKGAPLPRELSTDGMPAGDDPQIADLGYWAPDGNLVLYYGDVGYWTGIMRIGHFDEDIQAIAAQSGDFDATVELVG